MATANLDRRTGAALKNAYQQFAERWDFNVHLMLRPACTTTQRDVFTKKIRQLFTDTEKHYFGNITLKRRRVAALRVWRLVFIEKEDADIHAHVLVQIPSSSTHNSKTLDVKEFSSFLCTNWIQLSQPNNFLYGYHYHAQPAYDTLGNSYGVKELLTTGNTDCWCEKSSWVPKRKSKA